MVIKECVHCGKKFNAKNNKIFCSKECKEALIFCAECGQEHKRGRKNPNGEYICSSCYNNKYRPNVPLVICAECGKEHERRSKNPDGEYICNSCYNNKYKPDKPLIICAECGKEHKRNTKNPNGEYICSSCYNNKYRPDQPLIICAECGKEHKRNTKNPDGEYICKSCYEKKYRPNVPLVICAECGKEHKRDYKNSDGEYICSSCYKIYKCKEIINNNMQYYNFEDEDDIDLFLSDMKKKHLHTRMYRQLECELLGYGNYNEAMNQAIKRDNYTCQIIGKKGNIVVHHLNSYNTHKELACDLNNLITIDKDFHNLYHSVCGYGNNTEEQFWEFVAEWEKDVVTFDDFK